MAVDLKALSAAPVHSVLRPVQYLGSKLRSLDAIADVVDDISPGGAVADPFSGTSVVAQALAGRGHRVLASDALVSSATCARALLGVGREPVLPEELLDAIRRPSDFGWFDRWGPWLEREASALTAGRGDELISLSLDVPQIWRRAPTDGLDAQFDALAAIEGRTALGVGPLAAAHYAGTYFGIGQALEIDAILQSIQLLRLRGDIGRWVEAVFQTALLSAASEAAFSAGKHYAQPHAIHRSKNLAFAQTRIVQDRAKDIRATFESGVRRVVAAARALDEGHRATSGTMEDLAVGPWFDDMRVLYADPPYTAQQYSRFYHVPEVLLRYAVPSLHREGGTLTRGLYPTGRFKSRFSSKRGAPGAFADLCGIASSRGASLVISYSDTASGSTGNDRMISMAQLLATCERFYPRRVEVVPLAHAYRQFNGTRLAVGDRDDPEFLIACRADPC